MKFIPYGRQSLDEDDIQAVVDVLRSDFLTTGPAVALFEEALCEYTGAMYSVAVSSGTAALHLAALAMIDKGDKVLVSPITFAATSNAILYAGGVPVFVDIEPEGNIDLDMCAELLSLDSEIKHLFVTHMTGRPVDEDKLAQLKERFGIKILEDCAHSLGASQKGHMAGGCFASDCSILSFHPVKHITTGEGGAVVTNSAGLHKKISLLRSHGITKDTSELKDSQLAYDIKGNVNPWYYEMQLLGFNYRITDIQCALGISQIRKLEGFVNRRRGIAQMYDGLFSKKGVFHPLYEYDKNSAYHLYVVQADFDRLPVTRAELFNSMREMGVGLQVHYIPVPMLPYYSDLGYNMADLPNASKYYERCFSIPVFPSMADADTRRVADSLYRVVG
jgi:UDP-4-amino-4,6-dideoxy-N-acetyl-beta-L-altrosamine transaminase